MKKSILIILVAACVIVFIFGVGLFLLVMKKAISPGAKAIGVIEVTGPIYDSRDIIQQLKSLTKNPMVKGILLRIDSPGGGVSASQEIYTSVKSAKAKGKKVVVSMGAICASGGYYIACPADVIVANPGTLTGSIGVIMELPIIDELLKKLGVHFEVIKSKEHKDIGSPFRPLTDNERQLLNEMTADIYDQFIQAISDSRKISIEKIVPIADGRIFSGRQALALGLVDSLGSYEDAKIITARLCGIAGEPQIIKERVKFSFFKMVLGRSFYRLFFPIPLYLSN